MYDIYACEMHVRVCVYMCYFVISAFVVKKLKFVSLSVYPTHDASVMNLGDHGETLDTCTAKKLGKGQTSVG